MRLLYLIRHAQTRPIQGQRATDWPLTAQGRVQAGQLAEQLSSPRFSRVITSTESKATETGRAIAERLSVPLEQRDGLQEHGRTSISSVDSDLHLANMRLLFSRPLEQVYGDESAESARLRLAEALEGVMGESKHDELVVSHGTVISLLIAQANGFGAQGFWESVSMPDAFVLEWPSLKLLRRGSVSV